MINATGQLRHHFWGEYHATIALRFGSPDHARLALAVLPGFKPHPKSDTAIYWHGTGDDLKPIEDLLVRYGADRRKIGSLRHSIDVGEPFTIDVPPAALETQIALDLASDRG